MLYQFYLFTAINRNGLEADSKLYSIYANSGIWTWSSLKPIHGSTDEFGCRLMWQWTESTVYFNHLSYLKSLAE